MKIIYKLALLVFTVILFLLPLGERTVFAQEGAVHTLDGHQEEDFYTNLDGAWNFFEEKLLTPEEIQDELNEGRGEVVSIPDSFEAHTGEVNSFGTYSTTVQLPESYVGETLAVHVPYQYSAYRLFIDDILVASNGVVGENAVEHEAEMAPERGYFIAESDELLITMQVSSFDHIRGGFENSIYIGEAPLVAQNFNTTIIVSLFINGSIFIIGLFMVLFALYRGRERSESLFFIFGMFAMLISVRALFAVPFYYTLVFDISWVWGRDGSIF